MNVIDDRIGHTYKKSLDRNKVYAKPQNIDCQPNNQDIVHS